ncbi:MAG TPA: hypothetical protein VE733_23340 [Streptosporangiaceae bacterium]|nr:hypothetical protein [Streptosporangiaceae bacterium]
MHGGVIFAASHAASTGIGAKALALALGAFGALVGWRLKLMHRAWQDVKVARETMKLRLGQRRRHTIMAFFFAIATVLVLYVLLRG